MTIDLQDVLVVLTGIVYAISAIGYGFHFKRRGEFRGRVGSWGLMLGWGIHSILLASLTLSSGEVPFTSQVLPSVCAWLVVIVYLYLELTTRDRCLGALIVPIITLLHLLSVFNMLGTEEVSQATSGGLWFRLHVLAYILAYAAFAISCVSSIMYVMLLEEIQRKHLGFFYERLPPLGILDQNNNRAATFGLVFLTGGIVLSSVWAVEALNQFWVWNEPTFFPILLAWVIYAVHFVTRTFAGWQGRRAALFSIVGFLLVVFAFPVVGVLLPGKHPFGP